MNDANIIEDYEDESISKYTNLLKETSERLSKLKETKSITRNEIFIKALNEFRSLDWVEEELAKSSMDPIKIRRPDEVVLKFALLCNSFPKAPKYDYKGFKNLWNDLNLQKQCDWKRDSGTSESLTFQQIVDIVKENKYNKEENIWQQTLAITIEISDDFNALIDFESETVVDDFKAFYEKYLDKFADASQSVRYYFFKYLFFMIIHQIGELKDTLLDFSKGSWNSMVAELKKEDQRRCDSDEFIELKGEYKHSIKVGMRNNRNVQTLLINALQNLDDYDLQGSKDLLSSVLDNFLLFGTSKTKENHFKVFGAANKSLSTLEEQTAIFEGGKSQEKHENAVEALNNTVIEDFYGYKVRLDKVYEVMFNSSFSQVTDQSHNTDDEQKRQFVLNIYKSRYDLSRSAMLLFLLSAKYALFDTKKYLFSHPFFDKKCEITYGNVNKLLERMGYVPFDFEEGTERSKIIDELYKVLFLAPESDRPEILGVLNNFIDILKEDLNYECYDYLPVVPFEILTESSQKRRKKLVGGK